MIQKIKRKQKALNDIFFCINHRRITCGLFARLTITWASNI